MADLDSIRQDLAAEHAALDEIVAPLTGPSWDVATPAEPWTVRDQISHLAFFDEQAVAAVVSPEEFVAGMGALAADVDGFMNAPLERGRSMPPADVLAWWRQAREESLRVFDELAPDARVPWFGPPMSAASFVTARLMETWAHGQDVADALRVERAATGRLRHVAHIGVRARAFSYTTRGMEVPAEEVGVHLAGPSGETWTWNEEAAQRVSGPALDFCLVVTQRRHVDDTALTIEGPLAVEWMGIAQSFAGPPGAGRRPGQFTTGAARA
jgi:uncharacterized protein (TIGR03084 family)